MNISISEDLYAAFTQIKNAIVAATGEEVSDEQVMEVLIQSFFEGFAEHDCDCGEECGCNHEGHEDETK